MHVTRNSANGDICQPVKQLPQVNWWKSHHWDGLKPSWAKHCKIHCREQSWSGSKINNGLLSHSAQKKSHVRVFRILQGCAGLACPFRGLQWQCSSTNSRLDLSSGRQRARGKGERANLRAWNVAYIALTTLFLGHSPSLPWCQSSLSHCYPFPLLKHFFTLTSFTTTCNSPENPVLFIFLLHFPMCCCWSHW